MQAFVYVKLSYFRKILNGEVNVLEFIKNAVIFYQRMDKRLVEIELDLDKEIDSENLLVYLKSAKIEF